MKKVLTIGLTALIAVALLIGIVAYSYLKPALAASEPIQAIPITQTTTPAGSTGAATAATTLYTIDQASSQATFTIDEVLNGADKTVVGTTDQVAGQISVNPANPETAQIGTIQINARTLTTDSDQRNNVIRNMILKTNDNEYITFMPTSITGLPATATVGESYRFQVIGQLTIAGQTHEATFAVTVTPTATGQLSGSATTTIKYADWGVGIPSVPVVTGVADTVGLQLAFVATTK